MRLSEILFLDFKIELLLLFSEFVERFIGLFMHLFVVVFFCKKIKMKN